jgi:hypothetical protein
MRKISEVYVFVIEDTGPTDEGVIALHSEKGDPGPWAPDGRIWMPIVAVDPLKLAQLTPLAVGIAQQLGKTLHLLKFTRREEISVVHADRMRAA